MYITRLASFALISSPLTFARISLRLLFFFLAQSIVPGAYQVVYPSAMCLTSLQAFTYAIILMHKNGFPEMWWPSYRGLCTMQFGIDLLDQLCVNSVLKNNQGLILIWTRSNLDKVWKGIWVSRAHKDKNDGLYTWICHNGPHQW